MANAALWACKRLGILPRYRVVAADSARAEAERIGLVIDAGETLVGLFTNPAEVVARLLAITSRAVAVGGPGGWARMPYAALSAMRFEGGKEQWDVLTLVSIDGRELPVHMPGEVEKPITSLACFLRKVSAAQQMFDRAAIAAASARHRDEWAARVAAGSGRVPMAKSPV
jgi:hypothetical protein